MMDTAPTLGTRCALCSALHDAPLARWRCGGCELTLCAPFVIDGRQWNRKGRSVHILKGPDKVLRVCGVLTPEPDAVEDIVGPGEAEPVAAPAEAE